MQSKVSQEKSSSIDMAEDQKAMLKEICQAEIEYAII